MLKVSCGFEPSEKLNDLSVSILFTLNILLVLGLDTLFVKLVKLSICLLKTLFAQILLFFKKLFLTLLYHKESFFKILLRKWRALLRKVLIWGLALWRWVEGELILGLVLVVRIRGRLKIRLLCVVLSGLLKFCCGRTFHF